MHILAAPFLASLDLLLDPINLTRCQHEKFRRALWFLSVGGFVLAAMSPPSVQAQVVTATLAAGTNPYAVTVNPITNTIYIANWNSASVTVIDGATSAVAANIYVGVTPWAVAVDPITNMI